MWLCSNLAVLLKNQNPWSPYGPPKAGGWVAHPNPGWPVITNVEIQTKFKLCGHTEAEGQPINNLKTIELECQHRNFGEFTSRQPDHLWWGSGSPGAFMGRIWRPGDRFSKALSGNVEFSNSFIQNNLAWALFSRWNCCQLNATESHLFEFDNGSGNGTIWHHMPTMRN